MAYHNWLDFIIFQPTFFSIIICANVDYCLLRTNHQRSALYWPIVSVVSPRGIGDLRGGSIGGCRPIGRPKTLSKQRKSDPLDSDQARSQFPPANKSVHKQRTASQFMTKFSDTISPICGASRKILINHRSYSLPASRISCGDLFQRPQFSVSSHLREGRASRSWY